MHTINLVANKDYHFIGIIQKVQGLQGYLVVQLADGQTVLPTFTTVFVHIHATYVPYLVDIWQEKDGYALVKLTHITTRTEAEGLRDYSIFLPKKAIHKVLVKEKGYTFWIGFVVEDIHQGVLGQVTCVKERTMQPFLEVDYQGKELLIPVHKSFVKEANTDKKRIKVDLPQGYISTLGI